MMRPVKLCWQDKPKFVSSLRRRMGSQGNQALCQINMHLQIQ